MLLGESSLNSLESRHLPRSFVPAPFGWCMTISDELKKFHCQLSLLFDVGLQLSILDVLAVAWMDFRPHKSQPRVLPELAKYLLRSTSSPTGNCPSVQTRRGAPDSCKSWLSEGWVKHSVKLPADFLILVGVEGLLKLSTKESWMTAVHIRQNRIGDTKSEEEKGMQWVSPVYFHHEKLINLRERDSLPTVWLHELH